MSAWIETQVPRQSETVSAVALLVSAWIETQYRPQMFVFSFVALLVSAWIETVGYREAGKEFR